jgi:phosphoglycerate kinase
MKKNIDQINVQGKRVLVRLDLNVPLDGTRITDETRITAALPTIQKLIKDGGRLILVSHLGRPTGNPIKDKQFSLAPVAERLSERIGKPVKFVPKVIGGEVMQAVDAMQNGDVCLLENLRFHEAETIKDKDVQGDVTLKTKKEAFALAFAEVADVYVNDAFGTCHRDNASMLTVPRVMEGKPKVVGYLVQKELNFLGEALKSPERPFTVVLGGAKVSDKIPVIENLLETCDHLLIGGAMCYTFFAAEGREVGRSLIEADRFEQARELRSEAGAKLHLPLDSIGAQAIEQGVETRVCTDSIPGDLMGLDIGPATIEEYSEVLRKSKTIFWNGPMGVFETPPFDNGTRAIAQVIAEATDAGATSIIGGGDSAAAVHSAGLADRISHISTGGGASLEFLEGKKFDAIEVLDEV